MIDNLARDAEGQGPVGPWSNDHDLVRLAASRVVLSADYDDFCALDACFGQPVGIRHLGRDPVHAPADRHFGVIYVAQIKVHRLLACDHRVARWQVGVPGVVVEPHTTFGILWLHTTNVGVEQSHRVGLAVLAEKFD